MKKLRFDSGGNCAANNLFNRAKNPTNTDPPTCCATSNSSA